jgi:hypothetical protein
VFAVGTFVADGFVPALLRGATWPVLGVALWTLLWTYGALQTGLVRLGRERLRPEAVRVDPGLGLRPLGDLAFMGLWLILAALVPIVLTGLPDVVGAVLGGLVLASALLLVFLSLVRLHRQMVAVKERELAFARKLYAEAYDPVRTTPTLETLERQQPLLAAADALEAGAGDPRLADRRGDLRARAHDRDERRRDRDRQVPRPVRALTATRGLSTSRRRAPASTRCRRAPRRPSSRRG